MLAARPRPTLIAGALAVLCLAPAAWAKSVSSPVRLPSEARVLSRAFSSVARAVAPAVVRLEVKVAGGDATASGLIIDTNGNIVTSSHALEGAEAIDVVLVDDRRLGARIVGRDSRTDVALLRLTAPPADLTSARFGDSEAVTIGEWVLAIGSPLGLDQSTTAGIVSGRTRLPRAKGTPSARVFDLIQTDANVSAGSAGGPLVNLDGEVIGLSSLGTEGPDGGYGFAIPINQVRRVAQMLAAGGPAEHPYFGVALLDLADLDADERQQLGAGLALPSHGVVVNRILEDTPAARAGLRPGDVITSINNQSIPAAESVAELVSAYEVGTRLMVSFVRQGRERTVPVALGALPPVANQAGSASRTMSVISAGAPSRIGGPQ